METVFGLNTKNTLDLRERLPLGRGVQDAKSFNKAIGVFEIYIPTDYGGTLTVGFGGLGVDESANEIALWLPGKPAENFTAKGSMKLEIEAGERGEGYVYAVVKGVSRPYSLYATFAESGLARVADGSPKGSPLIPWNFWYFPSAASSRSQSVFGPHFHPLEKYERATGMRGAKAWEKEHHWDSDPDAESWEGHCDFAARASIAFEAPPSDGLVYNGVRFSAEELKFLATEVAARYLEVVDVGYGLPGVYGDEPPPTEAELRLSSDTPSADPDLFGQHPRALRALLDMLRKQLREEQRAVVMDLRNKSGSNVKNSGQVNFQKWNHAVYMYTTMYYQTERRDPYLVTGVTRIYANEDLELNGKCTGFPATLVDEEPPKKFGDVPERYSVINEEVIVEGEDRFSGYGRIQEYTYQLRWLRTGHVDWSSKENRWLRCTEVPQWDPYGEPKDQWIPRYALGVGKMLSEPANNVDAPEDGGNPFIDSSIVRSLLPLRKGRK